ncbi:MAG: hypothetical protein RMN25_00595 [Anaerolineae bacterium]|nr:MFS transporter [Thermoflexales bacterium]MDW8406253.1 hypothetical protein [Anaerolineae bacterium]
MNAEPNSLSGSVSLASDNRPEENCPYVASGPTALRCSKCDRPLMPKDARRTPTGYVCPYYVKARVATFYNAQPIHYLIGGAIAFGLGIIGGWVLQLVGSIGFFAIILSAFVGPIVGGVVAEAVRRVLGKTRGQYMWLVAAIAMAVGATWFTILPPIVLLLAGSPAFIFALIPVLGLALAIGSLIARLRI